MTIFYFDERFNFVKAVCAAYTGDGEASASNDPNKNGSLLQLPNATQSYMRVPINGYVYVCITNSSRGITVYNDNLQITLTSGAILEENHYYPYGLKIASISSHELPSVSEGNTDNKYLYNDKELWDEGDLNWYDYGFRNYDPQIGRFTQLDPLTWEYPELTNYQYASCEPIANVDRDGLEADPCVVGPQDAFISNLESQGMINIGTSLLDNGNISVVWSDPCLVNPYNITVQSFTGNLTGGISTPSDGQNLVDWGKAIILQPFQNFDNFMRNNQFLKRLDDFWKPLPEHNQPVDNSQTPHQVGGTVIYAEGECYSSFQTGSGTAQYLDYLDAGNMFGLLHTFGAPTPASAAPEGFVKRIGEGIDNLDQVRDNGKTINDNRKGGNGLKQAESTANNPTVLTKFNPSVPNDTSKPDSISVDVPIYDSMNNKKGFTSKYIYNPDK